MKNQYLSKFTFLSFFFIFLSIQLKAQDVTVSPGGDIQTAIDNVAASGGGVVTLAAGTHNITTPVRIKSNVTIQGEGDWASLLKTTVNMQMIVADAEGLVNLTIQNLAIEGTNALNGGGIQITSQGVDHDNIKLLNVHCYKTGWGVHIKGAKNLLVKDCLFEENGKAASVGYAHNMYLRRVYGAEVRDSKFLNCISSGGINISYSEDIEIYNCEMSGNYYRGVRAAVTDGFLVHDCIVNNNGTIGIYANAEIGIVTTNVDIKRNCVSNNGEQGISALNGATGVIADNNSYNNVTNYSIPSGVTQSNNVSDSNISCVYTDNSSVSLSAISDDGFVTLSWYLKNITATNQDIYRNTDSDPSGRTLIASNVDLATFTYIDNTVVNGTTYWYWIEATDASATTFDSNAASATPNPVLAPNVMLSATPGDGFVTLNWDIQGINIAVVGLFRHTDISGSGRQLVKNYLTGTSYTDTSVVNDTEYWYWLKVKDDVAAYYENDAAIYAFPSASLSVETNSESLEKVIVYPNPGSNKITIDMPVGRFSDYTIYDLRGRVNMNGTIINSDKKLDIDISSLSKGIYMISMRGNQFTKVLKVVKK